MSPYFPMVDGSPSLASDERENFCMSVQSFSKRRSKFGNKLTTVDGRLFHSKREASRYIELKVLEKAGAIRNLECQVPVKVDINGKHCFKWIADFVYFEGQDRIWEDVKGYRTSVYKLKKRVLEAHLGVKIREV